MQNNRKFLGYNVAQASCMYHILHFVPRPEGGGAGKTMTLCEAYSEDHNLDDLMDSRWMNNVYDVKRACRMCLKVYFDLKRRIEDESSGK